MLFCRMKMSLSQHPSLSNHCAPLKEKVAGEEENEKKNLLCRYFTNILTKESLTCYLLLGFRELICIEMFHL